ncbi:hypothetical protein BJL96_13595 [Burkholderia cenocepacia]|nr:hypothetical protein A3203_28640 [Burkholderia cenocepacia]NGO94711.1 hypothetical protein [Burkholderia cenocepacia]
MWRARARRIDVRVPRRVPSSRSCAANRAPSDAAVSPLQRTPRAADDSAHAAAPRRPARMPASRSVTHAPACRMRAAQPHRSACWYLPQLH